MSELSVLKYKQSSGGIPKKRRGRDMVGIRIVNYFGGFIMSSLFFFRDIRQQAELKIKWVCTNCSKRGTAPGLSIQTNRVVKKSNNFLLIWDNPLSAYLHQDYGQLLLFYYLTPFLTLSLLAWLAIISLLDRKEIEGTNQGNQAGFKWSQRRTKNPPNVKSTLLSSYSILRRDDVPLHINFILCVELIHY